MSNIEKIRQEIERLKNIAENDNASEYLRGQARICRVILSFIDSLPEENNPEPYNPVYDEDYLNEKIAKATKSWEGVDVDKMLADCRGYEEKPSEDLEDEIKKFIEEYGYERGEDKLLIAIVARHFAEWQKEQDQPITGNSLEQEWLRYVDRKKKECRGELPALGEYGWLQIARHFANWQKKKDRETIELAEEHAILAGRVQMKEEMMKDAVEGEVIYDLGGFFRIKSEAIDGAKYKVGSWVKLIIVKED